MTKLGVTPGVHGEEAEKPEDELATVKVDPKVFTILQPVGITPPTILTTPPPREKSSACKWLIFITLLTSATILTFFLCNLYLADQPLSKIFVITTPEIEPTATSEAPKAEAQKSEPIVVLPVKQVDGGSENTSERGQQPLQQPQDASFEMNPWMAAAQARWAQQQEEANWWRMRRIQHAFMQQQMMKEAWQREQMWMAEQQKAQWIARAQWEAAREQAAQAEQWRAEQMRQQQAAQAQEQWNQQWQQYYQAQAQQAQAQQAQAQQAQAQQAQAQQPQQNWQQFYWQNQQQQQQMPQPHPRLILLRHLTRVLPVHMSFRLPEQSEQEGELPQPAIHDRIYQQLQRKSQGMEFNAPSRPIWTAITPTPETPTTKFDEEATFQENLKKSLEHETVSSSPAPPVVPEEDDEKHSESEDGVLKDIFSALASAASETTATPTTAAPEVPSTENVFTAFSTDQDKKIDADVKENNQNVFKAFETEEDKQQDSEKAAEKSGFSAFNAEGAPKEEAKIEEPQAQEPQESAEVKSEESSLPVVVFEDRFPKLEERTTTSETPVASTESSKEEEGSEEQHDPLAAFLRYFEQEARRMAEIRAAANSEVAAIDPQPTEIIQPTEMAPEGEAAQSPAAVDVPEANFKPAAPITV